ncbi:MAG TPA: helix-hairpin-helix domain-containing protein [Candidatus Syntrophosphaera sp.]|nr:helix-hairpin-helix domain-containing protein [Candidatus Syntrophosphaera sp.]
MARFPKDFLTSGEQRALLFLIGIGLLGFLLNQLPVGLPLISPQVAQPQQLMAAVQQDQPVQIDIRSATKDELILLPGIGEKRAQDILDHRRTKPFASLRDLLEIKGIGPKTLAKMLPLLLPFGPDDAALILDPTLLSPDSGTQNLAPTKSSTPAAAQPKTPDPPKSQLTNIVNPNTASLAELCTLPGIGEVKARAIIAYREQNGPFTDLSQLLQVKGIGPKTLEKLRPRLSLQ